MELLELLKKRRSHRQFLDREIEPQLVDKIIEATLTAPSSKNSRSTRFMIVRDRQMLEKMSTMRSTGSALLKDTPLAIVVMGDTDQTDLWVDNCAISTTIMQLFVESQGLASCWVHVNGRPHRDEAPVGQSAEQYLREFLPIPQNYRTLCVVAIGYPTQTIPPHKPKDDSDKVIIA